MDNVLSVRQLTERLRAALEQKFPYVWVRGEVTNLSRPSSGHIYFSLKEGDALLSCVWFRGQQRAQSDFDPLTGEVYEDGPRPSPALALENGKEMICAGRLSIYPPRGSYQLVVDLAQEAGLGQWHLAFEALKQKLAAQGYFAPERKRPLPTNPARVALITALSGAALQDFLRISSERGLGASIRIFPSPVQGDEAPARLIAALQEANTQGWADLIVMIRGGGSIQDLWAFNDEALATAIYQSPLPVLTGVGHEIDHSIADFVADKSAATPSHAAQMLWPERREYVQRMDELEGMLHAVMRRNLDRAERKLEQLERNLGLLSPLTRLRSRERNLNLLTARLATAAQSSLQRKEFQSARLVDRLLPLGPSRVAMLQHSLDKLELRLEALSPLAPLERGYALVRGADGKVLRGVEDVQEQDCLDIEMQNGHIRAVAGQVSRKEEPPCV